MIARQIRETVAIVTLCVSMACVLVPFVTRPPMSPDTVWLWIPGALGLALSVWLLGKE